MKSKEFKEWKKWHEKTYPDEHYSFNEEFLYELFKMNEKENEL